MKSFTLLSTTLTILLSSPTLTLASPGSICSGRYAADGRCICLTEAECTSYPGSTVVPGSPGDYPCPDSGADVFGCYVSGCLGAPENNCEFGCPAPLPGGGCPGAAYTCCAPGP